MGDLVELAATGLEHQEVLGQFSIGVALFAAAFAIAMYIILKPPFHLPFDNAFVNIAVLTGLLHVSHYINGTYYLNTYPLFSPPTVHFMCAVLVLLAMVIILDVLGIKEKKGVLGWLVTFALTIASASTLNTALLLYINDIQERDSYLFIPIGMIWCTYAWHKRIIVERDYSHPDSD